MMKHLVVAALALALCAPLAAKKPAPPSPFPAPPWDDIICLDSFAPEWPGCPPWPPVDEV